MYTVYAKEGCKYCHYASELLELCEMPYQKLMLGVHFTADEFKAMFPNWSTYPAIVETVEDGTIYFIGGFTELQGDLL